MSIQVSTLNSKKKKQHKFEPTAKLSIIMKKNTTFSKLTPLGDNKTQRTCISDCAASLAKQQKTRSPSPVHSKEFSLFAIAHKSSSTTSGWNAVYYAPCFKVNAAPARMPLHNGNRSS
ncbi:hypothetical protein CEXT_173671 [Caerostris extrusa]|uniref:Uncharacterized protein n=1 Tax=Caerostris extrusa TaxID=172846 RepID=A0AAV4V0T9_CAEEX|nr:hypothetical protein CEXT_173671 [Caerostris extrusa]